MYAAGNFVLDFTVQECRLRGERVPLTSLENRLLAELVRHAGMVLTHRFLLEQVWGPEYVSETKYLKGFVSGCATSLRAPTFVQSGASPTSSS